jgi:phosphoribosylanthranilate isomerase
MTWIKICGITNLEDGLSAVEAGADALGFVFHDKSLRCVNPEVASEIISKLPEGVEKVGVFVDDPIDRVREIVKRAGLTAVQLYQKECAETIGHGLELMPPRVGGPPKIIFVVPGDQFAGTGGVHLVSGFWGISKGFKDILFALLLDSSSDVQPGGTGRQFDWIRVRGVMPAMNAIRPTIVAGGLNPSNVNTALTLLRPWGVDVSSGVEAKPGKKDPEKVRSFIAAVRQFDKTV